MPDRLSVTDDNLFPVQAFFNAIPDFRFIPIIESLLSGVGAIINDTRCTFPGDLDPGEEMFEGVQFSLFEAVAVLSEEEMRRYIHVACRSYLNDCPDDEVEVNKMLQGSK